MRMLRTKSNHSSSEGVKELEELEVISKGAYTGIDWNFRYRAILGNDRAQDVSMGLSFYNGIQAIDLRGRENGKPECWLDSKYGFWKSTYRTARKKGSAKD